MKTFINFSNHPFASWSEKQKIAAMSFGSLVEVPFPEVDPQDDIFTISAQAEKLVSDLAVQFPIVGDTVVLVQGEMTLLYQILKRLEAKGYRVVAATSTRDTIINPDGTETKTFHFNSFRDYFENKIP